MSGQISFLGNMVYNINLFVIMKNRSIKLVLGIAAASIIGSMIFTAPRSSSRSKSDGDSLKPTTEWRERFNKAIETVSSSFLKSITIKN